MIKRLIFPLIAILCLSLICYLYFYNLVNSYSYDSDFGRDISDILQITQGKQTLLGPKLSFGGIHTGPYYYYLFAPIVKLFPNSPEALLYFNTLIFLVTLALCFLLIASIKSNSKYIYLLGITWIFITPYMIFSARGPGNAFSYFPLLFVLLMIFPWIIKSKNKIVLLSYGFFSGIVLNFHLINLLIFTPLILILFLRRFFAKSFIICFGILISFTPFLFFEIRHNFVQLQNTFIFKSYQMFSNNENLSHPPSTSTNPIINFSLLLGHLNPWSSNPFIILFAIIIVLFIIRRQHLTAAAIASFILFCFVARSQIAVHYLFPFIMLTQIAIIHSLSTINSKIPALIIILVLLLTTLSDTPPQLYQSSNRQISDFRNTSNQILNSALFSKIDPKYNVFSARETTVAVMGWEYRYFFSLAGKKPQPQDSFSTSNHLLIIQESANTQNINSLKSWELDQFGPKQLLDSTKINNRNIYLFQKIKSK